MYWSWRGVPESGGAGGAATTKPSAAAGPADKGTLVRPRFRRRAQRAWARRCDHGPTATSLALLARKAGGTERPKGLGPDCRTATPTAPALQRGPDSLACERVHAASGLLRRLRETPSHRRGRGPPIPAPATAVPASRR